MSYVAIREVTPASGKEAVLQERMLRLSAVSYTHLTLPTNREV